MNLVKDLRVTTVQGLQKLELKVDNIGVRLARVEKIVDKKQV